MLTSFTTPLSWRLTDLVSKQVVTEQFPIARKVAAYNLPEFAAALMINVFDCSRNYATKIIRGTRAVLLETYG